VALGPLGRNQGRWLSDAIAGEVCDTFDAARPMQAYSTNSLAARGVSRSEDVYPRVARAITMLT